MRVNDYYSRRVLADGPYTADDEPLHLCDDCARRHASQVVYAGPGAAQAECEFCDATNDPIYSAAENARYRAFSGR